MKSGRRRKQKMEAGREKERRKRERNWKFPFTRTLPKWPMMTGPGLGPGARKAGFPFGTQILEPLHPLGVSTSRKL